MNKRVSVCVLLLLLAALILSLCPAALAEEAEPIRIRTTEDLLMLARECSLDT